MPRFVNYISGVCYDIGCTGQTVYVYDKNGTELAKFRDLKYAYYAAISPLGDIFAVKSADGRLAVYSFETLALVKKFRFSGVKCAQDDGFCFMGDGKYFINVERQGDDLHSAISVYDVADFSVVSQFLFGDGMMAEDIGEIDGELCVLGFYRDADMTLTGRFVAKYKDGVISEAVNITDSEYESYLEALAKRRTGK